MNVLARGVWAPTSSPLTPTLALARRYRLCGELGLKPISSGTDCNGEKSVFEAARLDECIYIYMSRPGLTVTAHDRNCYSSFL